MLEEGFEAQSPSELPPKHCVQHDIPCPENDYVGLEDSHLRERFGTRVVRVVITWNAKPCFLVVAMKSGVFHVKGRLSNPIFPQARSSQKEFCSFMDTSAIV